MATHADGNRRATETPREAGALKVAALEAEVKRLFGVLDEATRADNHTPEEIERNRGGLAAEIDKAIDSWAQAWKELARL